MPGQGHGYHSFLSVTSLKDVVDRNSEYVAFELGESGHAVYYHAREPPWYPCGMIPVVTLHELGEDPVTLPCVSVQVTQRITLGDSASITLKVPMGRLAVVPSYVNKWITVQYDGKRIFLGRVVNIIVGKSVDKRAGFAFSKEIAVECQSWWYLMRESLLVPAPAEAVDAVPGFVIKFDEWRATLQVLFGVVKEEGPGRVLEQLFQLWARVLVPRSITLSEADLSLADVIRVNWEEDPVLGTALNAIGNSMLDSSSGQMLVGTFTADPLLVEFFDTPDSLVYRMKPLLREHVDSATMLDSAGDYTLTFTDAKRVNAHFVTTALTTSARYGDWGFLGGPILERDSIFRNGLRIKDHTWPYFPNAQKSTFKESADVLIKRAEAMYRDDHLFGDGSSSGHRLDTGITPGTWRYFEDGLYVYLTEVTHRWRMEQGSGTGPVVSARTSTKFTRARYGGYRNLPLGSAFEAPYTTIDASGVA